MMKKILIAEDDESNYRLIKEMFQKAGTELIWAKNGQEAINLYVENQDVDVILMDMRMPIMDGETAAMKIKEINPDVPIIGVSSFDRNIMSTETNLDAYVQKPFLPNELVSVIDNHVKNLVDELLKREEERAKQWLENEEHALHVLNGVAELLELTDYVNKSEATKVLAKLDELKEMLKSKTDEENS